MFVIKIADIKIAIKNKFDFIVRQCEEYLIESNDVDFSVEVSNEEFLAEKNASGEKFSDGFIESVCIYRNIAKQLPYYNAFVLHCAAVEKDGVAYCFAARSGVGKTTHVTLWKKVFEDVEIINGDKPIVRFFNGKPFVCGTPWGGKENFHSNKIVPIRSICFLNRGSNIISRLTTEKVLPKILLQAFIPKEKVTADLTINMIGNLLKSVSFWSLECDISDSAAKLSYETMSNGE